MQARGIYHCARDSSNRVEWSRVESQKRNEGKKEHTYATLVARVGRDSLNRRTIKSEVLSSAVRRCVALLERRVQFGVYRGEDAQLWQI